MLKILGFNCLAIALYLVILFILFLSPLQALAWLNVPHKVIGAIAETKLTKTTKYKVNQLLQNTNINVGNKELTLFTSNIITASPWADMIKNDKYVYKNKRRWSKQHYIDINTYFKEKLTANKFIHRLHYLLHKNNRQLYYGIVHNIKILKNPNTTTQKKSIALRLLIHFVEDAHQPLHVSNPIIHHQNTFGGNRILLQHNIVFTDDYKSVTHKLIVKNLHKLWDSAGGYFFLKKTTSSPFSIKSTQYYASLIIKKMKNNNSRIINKRINTPNINRWLWQGYVTSYRFINNLSFDYKKSDRGVVFTNINNNNLRFIQKISTQQIYIAGCHLALLLNAIFDKKHSNKKYLNYVQSL